MGQRPCRPPAERARRRTRPPGIDDDSIRLATRGAAPTFSPFRRELIKLEAHGVSNLSRLATHRFNLAATVTNLLTMGRNRQASCRKKASPPLSTPAIFRGIG